MTLMMADRFVTPNLDFRLRGNDDLTAGKWRVLGARPCEVN
jgi:hypothetical protein